MKIWDPEYECLPREEMEQLQLERLQTTLHRVYKNVPFYYQLFQTEGISPDQIKSLGDLASIPFTREAKSHHW